ncbi:YbaB/EbfC family nucleoid-associated protein [Sphaerisporangium perillae]|uniref:YbaB/EbfC family nucleoid-associated protein n=1 Tax=Sphaerisporangium perillae TaxID=2935860 RepID=UPI00200FDB3E|nr:YbaB/EbfC family nucleoid-associated protein [Sphaerisporangium perillae]
MFDPDGFRLEDLERVAEQSEEALRRLSGVFGDLRDVTGEGTAAGGLVRAVVDGGGRIGEVTLDPRVMRLDSRSIAEAVTEAVRAAQQDAQRKNEELLRDAMGGDAPSLDPAGTEAWLKDVTDAMGAPWPHEG